MDYTKPPLSIQGQIDELRRRGLQIEDEQLAKCYLSNISFYRLGTYTAPFQDDDNPKAGHRFKKNDIRFSDIIDLYCFDRRLRSLMFNAIEKIEVAARTKILQTYAEETQNSNWINDRNLYKHIEKLDKGNQSTTAFDILMKDIEGEIKRSNEDYIKPYKEGERLSMPPVWKTLEVLSFGTLSRLYYLLEKSPLKKNIAEQFGLKDDRVLANWLHAISVWRNLCAHHSRVWNRRSIINIQMPTQTYFPFIDKRTCVSLHTNKVFAVLCCIKYISNIISPESDLKQNILSIIEEGGTLLNLREMGFPKNWKTLAVWK